MGHCCFTLEYAKVEYDGPAKQRSISKMVADTYDCIHDSFTDSSNDKYEDLAHVLV